MVTDDHRLLSLFFVFCKENLKSRLEKLTVFFRYAVATKDIPVGRTLLVEQPITWSLHPDR
jgi:hypothetical protein